VGTKVGVGTGKEKKEREGGSQEMKNKITTDDERGRENERVTEESIAEEGGGREGCER
jgi:hypothetical protein